MAKKMLIDATHPEETRVVVVDGNKVDDFDFESVNKKQLAGNIYLAKVTRVEPSLQAAFVDYGGNRHGFLAFAEIHPDYYQIPVADREALIAEEAAIAAREAENEDEGRRGRSRRGGGRRLKNGSEGADDAVKSDTDAVDPEGSEEDSAQESGRPSRSSRSRRGRGRKQVSPPVAEDNGITGFGVIDPEGGGLDGAPEPNAGQQVAAAETAEAKAEVGAAEQAATATDDHGGVAEIATNGASEQAAESDIATAAADDAPEEVAAAEDAGDAPETAEEPTTEVAEAEAPSDEGEAPEDGSEPDGPPRTIAESAGLEGEDEVVRGDVPSSEGGDADEAAPAEEAAEKPKPRRRRRTTKKAEEAPAEAASSEAAVAESAGSAAPAVESAVAPGEEGAEPVSAESEAPEAAEAASEEASTGTSPEAAAESATETATEDTSEGSSEAAGEAATGAGDAAAEATAAGETSSEESPSKPRRSRRGGKRSKKSEAKAAEDAPGDVETASEAEADGEEPKSRRSDGDDDGEATEGGDIDTVGAEDLQEEDLAARAIRRRRYKIQDVVKSRQIMLVQVVKEERGTKGAALTTYLSLAGRYCVLMPNTARGGGISRKITNASDRKRLREIVGELEVPQGMGLIVRTAGAERTRAEIKRDYEFLLRQWEQIRELTLRSTAPCLIYEEGSLIKRSIRDIYSKEIDAVLVEGEGGYREAKDYMKMLMPSHAKNVQQYQDQIPLFIRYQVESYLNGMFSPVVQLKSGGYLVIGVTEALVAIDVNSGRSTKEGSIEETATKTNLEAADEVARQLRLRDLAGLIVIDFIDMDESRNNRAVEKRMKDRLKNDRARIQVGRISGFGLMEMSRQRLRPGMLEATTKPCPHCHGQGFIRSDESLALGILREIEEEGVKGRASELMATMPVDIANYIVNSKRRHLAQIEERYGIGVQLMGDPSMVSPEYRIERAKGADRKPERGETTAISSERSADLIDDAEIVEDAPAGDGGRSRDNGRRRGDRRDDSRGDSRGDSRSEARSDPRGEARDGRSEGRGDGRTEARTDDGRDDGEGGGKKRRRGKRGGRRRRGNGEERERREDAPGEAAEDAMTEAPSEPGDGSADIDMSELEVAEAEVVTADEEPTPPIEAAVSADAPAAEPDGDAPALVEDAAPGAEDAAAPAESEVADDVEAGAEVEVEVEVPVEVAAAEAGRAAAGGASDEPASEEPPKPKRRGWWSLRR